MSGLLIAAVCASCAADEPRWRPLFNGRDLEGWTPKIRGYATGEDPMSTFRVENGLLTVGYERYGDFGARFGHLFFREPFSRYRLLVEYRLIGEQAPGGEAWARANSGVMIHAQSPGSMLRDQDFPISLEAQLLAGSGPEERPTANLCTPGTHVVMDGRIVEEHCIESSAPTFRVDRWVVLELIVRGDSSIVHLVNGDTVLTYERPVVGGGAVNGYEAAAKPDGTALTGGYIAVQSESHPVQFRRILIRRLPDGVRVPPRSGRRFPRAP